MGAGMFRHQDRGLQGTRGLGDQPFKLGTRGCFSPSGPAGVRLSVIEATRGEPPRAITTLSRKVANPNPRRFHQVDNEPRDSSAFGFVPRFNPKDRYRVFEGFPHARHSCGAKAGLEVGRYALTGISAAHAPPIRIAQDLGARPACQWPLFSGRDAIRCCMPLPVANEIRRRALPHRAESREG